MFCEESQYFNRKMGELMDEFLRLFFLFFIGCTFGWVLEVFYRRFNKNNTDRKWINPGLLNGPYLPIYGFGLCLLYVLAKLEKYNFIQNVFWNKTVLFIVMAFCMTFIEYIAGVIFIHGMKIKLWDYSKEKCNYRGIICLKFSIYWGILGAIYYFFINPRILNALNWFSHNIEFSFVLGTFFGLFIVDVSYSLNLVARIRKIAKENDILIRYEELKHYVRNRAEETKEKYRFMFALTTAEPLKEHLKRFIESRKEK